MPAHRHDVDVPFTITGTVAAVVLVALAVTVGTAAVLAHAARTVR